MSELANPNPRRCHFCGEDVGRDGIRTATTAKPVAILWFCGIRCFENYSDEATRYRGPVQ